MEKRCKLAIDLEGLGGVYYGGQALTGIVKVELDENIEIVGLELKLYGGCFVKWSEKTGPVEEKTEVEHTVEEIYFNETVMLWGQGKPKPLDTEVLVQGRHLCPFTVALPVDVPASYEGSHGWIRYYLLATLHLPESGQSVLSKRCFAVLRDLDLNTEEDVQKDLREYKECMQLSKCCKAGRIDASLHVWQRGFVPGQAIYADVQIGNLSPRKVKSANLTLQQVVRYGSDSKSSYKVLVDVCRTHGEGVKPGKRIYWINKNLVVPAVPPSRLDGCKFIDISYALVLNIDMSSRITSLSVPIIIGTTPRSDSLFNSWVYKAPCVSLNQRSRPDLKPDWSTHSLPGDQEDFHPKYKFYSIDDGKAVISILSLQHSPSQRRTTFLLLGDSNTQESTV